MLLLFLLLLLLPSVSIGQIACFSYAGGVLSCDSLSRTITITPLGSTGGLITEYGSGRNALEPYTIITPQPRRYQSERAPFLAPALPSLYEEPRLPSLGLPDLDLPGLEVP